MKNVIGVRSLEEKDLLRILVSFLLFIAPLCFLTVKSVTNTVLILLTIVSLARCLIDTGVTRVAIRNKRIFVSCVMLSLPFLCELTVQFARQEFSGRDLDAPARFLLGAIVLFGLHDKLDSLAAKSFVQGCVCGLCVLFFSVVFFPVTWAGKVATYFVDPLTVGVYSVVMLAALTPWCFLSKKRLFFYAILFVLTIWLVLETESRTAYVAVASLAVVSGYVLSQRGRLELRFVLIIGVTVVLLVTLVGDETLLRRSQRTIYEIGQWLSGNPDTSLGVRLGLVLLDVNLIRDFWMFGISDQAVDVLRETLSQDALISERVIDTKVLAGSHSEYLSQLTRRGLVFGSLSLFALFIYPFVYVRSAFLENCDQWLGVTLKSLVFALAVSSFGIQVFNLKMTSSFYAICLCMFYAAINVASPKDGLERQTGRAK